MRFWSFSIIAILLYSIILIFSPTDGDKSSSAVYSICTCQFETPLSKDKYPREMTRYIYVIEKSDSPSCCESELKKETLAFKETHKMIQSCPNWGLINVDTLSSTNARELSCYMPDGVFAIYPVEKNKDYLDPVSQAYYPNLNN